MDGLGNLARWRLSAGQAADVTEAETLLAGIAAGFVAADKAYDCDALIKTILRSERDLHRREQGTRSAEFQIAKGGVGEVALVGDVLHVDSPGGQAAGADAVLVAHAQIEERPALRIPGVLGIDRLLAAVVETDVDPQAGDEAGQVIVGVEVGLPLGHTLGAFADQAGVGGLVDPGVEPGGAGDQAQVAGDLPAQSQLQAVVDLAAVLYVGVAAVDVLQPLIDAKDGGGEEGPFGELVLDPGLVLGALDGVHHLVPIDGAEGASTKLTRSSRQDAIPVPGARPRR